MLPEDLRKLVMDSFVPVSSSFGMEIVREGDEADAFYVIESGRARVLKAGPGGQEIPLNVLRPGDSFGEIGLLRRAKRSASVRASSDIRLLKLDGSVFQSLLIHHPEIRAYVELQTRHRELSDFFRVYTAFTELPAEGMRLLLSDLEYEEIGAGSLVAREGEDAEALYVVEEGRLRVFETRDGRRHSLRFLRKGDFFGELALFRGDRQDASVEALSPSRLLRLKRSTFEKLIEAHPKFRERIEERATQSTYRRVARVPLDFADEILPADAEEKPTVEADQVSPEAEASQAMSAATAGGRRFGKRRKRIGRFPHVRQFDEMDCGAACLAMVCRYYGRRVSLSRIRKVVHTRREGTSLRALCQGASELGLAARSVKVSRSKLADLPMPAILHWRGNHWVVLYDVDERQARLADPAEGLSNVSLAELDEKWSGYAALFDYTEALDEIPEDSVGLSWMWPFVRPYLPLLLRALGLAAVVSGLQMLFPVLTQVVVDRVLIEQDLGLLRTVVFSMGGILVFMLGAVFVQRYLLSFSAVRIDAASLDFVTRKLLTLPMRYFHSQRTGDIQRRLDGIQEIREFLVSNAVSGLTSLTQLAAALSIMVIYSPLLALVFLATTPLYALLMRYSALRLRPLFASLEAAFGRYRSHQIDAIKGIETVKVLGAELALRERMLAEFHRIARRVFQSDLQVMGYQGMVQTVGFLSMMLFLWVGAQQVLAGQLTIGGLVAFNALVALANAPITELLGMWDRYQYSSVLIERLNDILVLEPEQGAERSELKPVRTLEGAVALHGVSFSYGGPGARAILQDIHLEVPAGKTVAIVGRSGSGKTTLAKCLAGLLDPSEGTILYDSVDLRTLNHRDLRQKIGFVLQENHLFDDTIERNIALGESSPDMDRVLWAARVANAHEFVEHLPLAYETRIGEGGIALSGGQKQRLAIARSIYNRPPVMILDEATSFLDTESERAIQENMERLLEGRTCFIIANRLSTIRTADLIVVLDRGAIVEQGDHNELMARQALYYYLCSQQLEL
jgi:ATP-binding cassette subfamily B protein